MGKLTPAGLSTLVRIATAQEHSDVREDARRILHDTAYTFAAVVLVPIIVTASLAYGLTRL